MTYQIVYTKKAIKSLSKIDQSQQRMIIAWIEKNLVNTENPKSLGKNLIRFYFPKHLPATLNIAQVNNRKVDVGYATILIENISLGGIKFLSTLKLPINANIKFNFQIDVVNEHFNFDGTLVYTNEERPNIFAYGVSLQMNESKKDRLAEVINKMTVLKKVNNNIPDTNFIEQDPYIYIYKKILYNKAKIHRGGRKFVSYAIKKLRKHLSFFNINVYCPRTPHKFNRLCI